MAEHDLLDRQLREYAARWRADLPQPAEPALGPTPSRWLVPAAAAAVLAIVLGAVWLATGTPDRRPSPADTTNPAHVVVPWKPLPATHPKLPTTRVGAPPAALVASAPACGPGDLRAHGAPSGAAAGTVFISVQLRPVGGPCTLGGYPTVELLDHGRPIDAAISHTSFGGYEPHIVLATRKHPASVSIGASPGHLCAPEENTSIRVRLPGVLATATVTGFGKTLCVDGDEPRAWAAYVARIQSGYQPHLVSPYDHVRVTGDLNQSGKAGSRLDFTVTLTSRDALVLDPCPDYSISGGSPPDQEFGLNCADVPYRDADGHPYLPADVPVTFAMQVTAPAHSTPKFGWNLESPTFGRSVHGTITIEGDPLLGSVSGTVLMTGGPAGTTTKVTSGIVFAHGRRWYKTGIEPDGSYALQMAPGRYHITVHTEQWNDGAAYQAGTVNVTGGTVTDRDLTLSIR